MRPTHFNGQKIWDKRWPFKRGAPHSIKLSRINPPNNRSKTRLVTKVGKEARNEYFINQAGKEAKF